MAHSLFGDVGFDAMLDAISTGRAAAEERLTLPDDVYAAALERADELVPLLEDEVVGTRAHFDGCRCRNCVEHGASFIIRVEAPQIERPYERHRIGMFTWWKFIAAGEDGVEWRWSFDDVGTAANYVRFREWFRPSAANALGAFLGNPSRLQPLDIPICHVSPYFCADNPSLYFYDRRTGFTFDAKAVADKERHFNGSGCLVVAKRDEPLLLEPAANLIASPWLNAEISVGNDAQHGKPALICHIDPEQTRRWPDLNMARVHVIQNDDVAQRRTLHVRHDEHYFPVARLIELGADGSATFELDETVKLATN